MMKSRTVGALLAATLLGACSQAADMPTEVAMPEVLASASADNNRPVIEAPVPVDLGVISCNGNKNFGVTNAMQRVERRGLNRHPLGNTKQLNAFLFSENYLFAPIATEDGNIWADVRTESEGRVTEDGEELALSLVQAIRWNGDVVKISVLNDGVFVDANIPATITETSDLQIKGKKKHYFSQQTIVFRWNAETDGYDELRSKITTNCR